ncbi:MAG: UDP-N-acetylmuramate--L-alanine ligase [Firmicutes bacterium]|nr:UDP-N-acetylmuramate--L-alanine ligase [Bacillota bacterium]MBT9157589.1 UDP-N-acetylmuramate--L-alanine ligase [Bacillota bacterium]
MHTPQHIHFIGVDGISMSALALIMQERGIHISGSDLKESPLTARLSAKGATIYLGHAPEQVNGADLVVYTAAIRPDNPEMEQARNLGLPIMSRAEFLGKLMGEARVGIAVSGSHGKTTTTALLGLMLDEAGLDPTVLIGGELDALGGNVRIGQSDYFVAEACEYVETFLALKPQLGIVLNIDADHLDYFRDLSHVVAAFRRFAGIIPKEGLLIACHDDINVRSILPAAKCQVITYGLTPGADWRAGNINTKSTGGSTFDVYLRSEHVARAELKVNGRHNIQNALACLAVGNHLGLPMAAMLRTLASFAGTHRRFELKGHYHGATVIDDYAHHPTEITATLSAARDVAKGRIITVFQPHTYSRTQALLADFAKALASADAVIIVPIYAAREKNTYGITAKDLAEKISALNQDVRHIDSLAEATNYLKTRLGPGDTLITMGAGDVHKVGEDLLLSLASDF